MQVLSVCHQPLYQCLLRLLLLLLLLLLALVNRATNDDSFLCAEVHTPTPVVTSGSRVTASCVVRDPCPLAEGQEDVLLRWHLDQRLLVHSSAEHNHSVWISRVDIPSFTDSSAQLTCCVQGHQACQVVGGVEIRAGFPPAEPQNLSCVTNLTTPSTLLCSWDPGPDPRLPTHYTLHTETSDVPDNKTYELSEGVHRYTIPRSDFHLFSEMEIFVRAVNALGEASSEAVFLEPLAAAKFDPPQILRVQGEGSGCLEVSWGMADHLGWVGTVGLEVLVQPTDHTLGSQRRVLFSAVGPDRPVEVCDLLHGTEYQVQTRVRFRQQSPWSEWSSSTGVTQERAPTGRLDAWMKVPREPRQNPLHVHLFWKPSTQFHANGRNLSYLVSLQRPPGGRGPLQTPPGGRGLLCATPLRHCALQLPRGARRVFLSAANAAGRSSSPTEVLVLQPRAAAAVSEVRVGPRGDTALHVQWTGSASSDITGYVVEWTPLCHVDKSLVFFDQADRNQSSLTISGGIEPYKPYGITVYPRFKRGIGLPRTVEGYSRQKTPSTAPNLQVVKNLHSYIELTWDEVPPCKRNGVVRSYRVFYWDQQGHARDVKADLAQRRVILTDLNSMWSYRAVLMVSTDAGSVNGSEILLTTMSMDALDVVFSVIAAGVALALLVIVTVMACFTKHERLKMCFWPMVPDPANSSIKRWTTTDTAQDFPPSLDLQEGPGSPVYLSHLSLLGLPPKMALEKGGVQTQTPPGPWLRGGSVDDTSDLGESVCGSSPPQSPAYSGSQQHDDSVPYGAVVFAGPYARQPAEAPPPAPPPPRVYLRSEATPPRVYLRSEATPPRVYLRSEATPPPRVYLRSESSQPLLEDDPPSPQQYQNMSSQDRASPQEHFSFGEFQDAGPGPGPGSGPGPGPGSGPGQAGSLWDDFPLLRALAMNDTESEI